MFVILIPKFNGDPADPRRRDLLLGATRPTHFLKRSYCAAALALGRDRIALPNNLVLLGRCVSIRCVHSTVPCAEQLAAKHGWFGSHLI